MPVVLETSVFSKEKMEKEDALITDCPGQCKRKIIVPNKQDGKTRLCKECFVAIEQSLLKALSMFSRAPEPRLAVEVKKVA
jgi:hypothetical protein